MLFDLSQNTNRADKLSGIKFRVFLASMSDVNIDNFPKPIGATISTNPLLPNRTFKYIDCQVESVKPETTAGESPLQGKIKIPVILEGISRQTLSWVYENIGQRVIVIWERCGDGQRFLAGSPCSGGLVVKLNKIGGQDGGIEGVSLDLEGGECPEPFWFYDGEVVREQPQVINLGGGTTFALALKSQYTLTDNASAKTLTDITNVTDGDVGRIVELVGAGVNHPTQIENSEKFILKNGLSYSAGIGTSISLQITKTDSGYAFYEVYRS